MGFSFHARALLACREETKRYYEEMKRHGFRIYPTRKLKMLSMTVRLPACMHARQHAEPPKPH